MVEGLSVAAVVNSSKATIQQPIPSNVVGSVVSSGTTQNEGNKQATETPASTVHVIETSKPAIAPTITVTAPESGQATILKVPENVQVVDNRQQQSAPELTLSQSSAPTVELNNHVDQQHKIVTEVHAPKFMVYEQVQLSEEKLKELNAFLQK